LKIGGLAEQSQEVYDNKELRLKIGRKINQAAPKNSEFCAKLRRKLTGLGGRPVVGHMPLEHGTLVRVQASQPGKQWL
jgi:hypothetical protein